LVAALGGYRETLWQSEDFDFHIRLAASGIRYTIVDEPLVIQRIRNESRSQNHCEAAVGMVESLRLLDAELPARYRPALAERAARAGSVLFRAGAESDASTAFNLAAALGHPTFAHERRLYRVLARAFGPERAERAGSLYRDLLPHAMRHRLAEAGW